MKDYRAELYSGRYTIVVYVKADDYRSAKDKLMVDYPGFRVMSVEEVV